MALSVSNDVFFLARPGGLIAWNCRTHEQFELCRAYVQTLLLPEITLDAPHAPELLAAGLLQDDQAVSPKWGWDRLSRLFHVGTSAQRPEAFDAAPVEQGRKYLAYCGAIAEHVPEQAFSYRRGQAMPSRPVSSFAVSTQTALLQQVLEKRSTNRTFSSEPIGEAALRLIMSETFRYRDHDAGVFAERGLSTPTRRRSSPSGGSLQSCEAYLLARNVEGLSPGIYHYWSDSDSLGRLSGLPQDMSFGALAAGQMLADELAALVVVTCRFDKLSWKYPHSRAYRVALLDAGHLSQTFQLMATAQGLRTWLTGMFFDWNLRDLLGLGDDSEEYPLLLLGLGNGPYCPFDRYMDVQ